MGAITEFFGSEQALAILGLPGLALLLAFTFYHALLKHRLITTIGQNQSFAILVLIIAYFLIVTVLVIRVYQPPAAVPGREAKAGTTAAQAVVATDWKKLDDFFARTSLATPLSTFDSTLGPATADQAIMDDQSTLRVRNYFSSADGLLVQIGYDGSSVAAIGAYDSSSKLRIPTLGMGTASDHGSKRSFERLSDFTLASAVELCSGAKLTQQFAGKFGNYAVSPCFFGRPGGYNHFAFLFWMKDDSGFTQDCSPFTLAGREITVADVRRCGGAQERPVGFVVTREAEALDPAIMSLVAAVDGD